MIVTLIMAGTAAKAGAATGQVANLVLGQFDFAHNGVNTVGSKVIAGKIVSAGLYAPGAVALDSAGHVYIADSSNNRVLVFTTAASFATAQPASMVLGQPDPAADFCNQGFNAPSASTLCNPQGVALDSSNNLYVSDSGNNRILRYNALSLTGCNSSAPCIGPGATSVFGQPTVSKGPMFGPNSTNFSASTCFNGGSGSMQETNQLGLCMPAGIALDQKGNLWVADKGNNRVLEFSSPAANVTADQVTGQANFTGHAPATSKTGLSSPSAVAFDLHANLYVADTSNNRVLEYDIPLQTANAGSACHSIPCAASLVFGQVSFTSSVCAYSGAAALCGPDGVAVDSSNRVYISDGFNSRVLEYAETSNLPINATAAAVYGQGSSPPSFTKTRCNDGDAAGDVDGLGPDSLCVPGGIAVDKMSNLWVADTGNHRVVRFPSNDTVSDVLFGQASYEQVSVNALGVTAGTGGSPVLWGAAAVAVR
jgi:sugar lactone lactonase YvrE